MTNLADNHFPKTDAMADYAAALPPLKIRHLPASLRSVRDFMTGQVTPSRLLCNLAIADLMPNLVGRIIEIGATKSGNHRRFSHSSSEYVLSNISKEEGYLFLDAMDMPLANDSVDNFVCVSSLEHMPDPWRAIIEIHRTLKPGGKLLLVVPFMFPFHAAPSDFFRFTDRGLAVMLKDFRVIQAEALGNVFSTCALFIQRSFAWSSHNNKPTRMITITLSRLIGLLFYFLSFAIRKPDDYPSLYCLLVEKQKSLGAPTASHG
jgi:SAM-dependent methyltransferase